MFGYKKKNSLVSPQSGECIPIEQVPDPVFAGKILGDGVAIKPIDNNVYSPCNGTIVQIAHTFHAIGIESEDGLELLVHLGINTVELEGKGFTCFIEVGQHVKVGDKLMEMDCSFIEKWGLSTISPFLITNMDLLNRHDCKCGKVIGGKTTIIDYQK